jgi:phenylalanyl-tRNA synthetase beta chain
MVLTCVPLCADAMFFEGRCADIMLEVPGQSPKRIGHFGILHPDVLAHFKLLYPVSAVELDLEHLL